MNNLKITKKQIFVKIQKKGISCELYNFHINIKFKRDPDRRNFRIKTK